jgi:hypothetical protein
MEQVEGFTEMGFIETATGFFGLAPEGIRTGDVVAIRAGCPELVYLRPRSDGRYAFVGPAWVCGFMYISDLYHKSWDRGNIRKIEIC